VRLSRSRPSIFRESESDFLNIQKFFHNDHILTGKEILELEGKQNNG